ncbi:MgtC/SapB family protein [Sinorhizobium meliloti]|uniref:MgtC/SapB family protein n=1 Tax=Rhizobium meliloti TaxID=382 RepID=UPI00399975B1
MVKQGSSVKGLVTAAGIWNAGAIGVAVGLGVANIAIILGLTNLFGLVAAEHARRSRSRR